MFCCLFSSVVFLCTVSFCTCTSSCGALVVVLVNVWRGCCCSRSCGYSCPTPLVLSLFFLASSSPSCVDILEPCFCVCVLSWETSTFLFMMRMRISLSFLCMLILFSRVCKSQIINHFFFQSLAIAHALAKRTYGRQDILCACCRCDCGPLQSPVEHSCDAHDIDPWPRIDIRSPLSATVPVVLSPLLLQQGQGQAQRHGQESRTGLDLLDQVMIPMATRTRCVSRERTAKIKAAAASGGSVHATNERVARSNSCCLPRWHSRRCSCSCFCISPSNPPHVQR